ncbi:MAG: glycosyltransferase [Planctomycetota bacterium]|nr:MAG: glycosyltransferase [Planctomycetota bacterium]
MRLAFLYPDLSRPGGAENVLLWTAAGMKARGHQIALFSAGYEPRWWPDLNEHIGVSAESLLADWHPIAALDEHDSAARLREKGRSCADALNDFDVVLPQNRLALHASETCDRPRLWFCQEPWRRLHIEATDRELLQALKRPEVEKPHPALDQVRHWIGRQRRWPWRRWQHAARVAAERRAVARLRGALVNSAYSARCFEEAFRRPAQIMDLAVLSAGRQKPLPWSQRRDLVVISGANPKKNLHGTLAVLRELRRLGWPEGERVHIWGGGSDGEAFRQLAGQWGLEPFLQWHGFLEEAEAERLLAQAKLCLYLPLCEPFGLVAAEAMAVGTPVLASDHGGPSETVRQGQGGQTVDPLLPKSAAECLQSMLASPEAWQAWSQAGAESVARRFRLDGFLDRMEDLFCWIASTKP